MASRRVSTPKMLPFSMVTSGFHVRRTSSSSHDREEVSTATAARSLESLDLEDGSWYDNKPQRGIWKVGHHYQCGVRTSGWVVLAALQTVIIFILAVHLHQQAVSIELSQRGSDQVGPKVEFVSNDDATKLSHLIMVPGHGVTITESLDGADSRDDSWFLLDYQKDKDVPRALVGHIRGGVEELKDDSAALLLFSGGKTRVVAGPKSEGESYFFVADHFNWWGVPNLRARASTEDFARDSFENLLFSLCRFKEVTGNYPTKITVVGFDFKEARFRELHREALRIPADAFSYIGLHPEGRFDHAAAETGEQESAIAPYRQDPYGCAPEGSLAEKRAGRNPFHRTPPYSVSCPEMRDLLDWCGPDYFEGDLPWLPAMKGGDP